MRGKPRPVRFVRGVDEPAAGARIKACVHFAGDVVSGADMLDIGCWSGAFCALVVDTADSVTGIDVERLALQAGSTIEGVRLMEASAMELPFGAAEFDVVTMWDVLEHLPRESVARALEEAARVLRPGGFLALSVPSDNLLAKALDPMYFPRNHRHYGAAELRALVENAGFRVTRQETRGGLITSLDFIVFCAFKYALRRPGISWERYKRLCERDACRDGFVELYMMAQRSD